MIKKWIAVVLILFCATTLAYGKTHGKKARRPVEKRVESARARDIKNESYKAYIVVEGSSGKVIDGENTDMKRPPASVTKLMLAAVVLDKVEKGEINLTDVIIASRDASKIGGSQVYLREGESFILEEMMRAILVASANDAAYAVAEHIGGSREEFVHMMNEKAKALGMNDSQFRSPHGLPPSKGQEEDLSTCNDLVILARELLKYPKIMEWTSIKSEGFRNNTFTMNNHNRLLIKMAGVVDGLKTGFYRETGFNVVVSAKKNDMRFIAVVLGSPSAKVRDNVAMEKLKKAFAQFKVVHVVKKGETIDQDINLRDGKYRKIKGVAGENFSFPVPGDKKADIKKEINMPESLKGEVKEGQKLGEIIIKLEDDIVGKVDIISSAYVPKANLFTRFIRRLGLNI